MISLNNANGTLENSYLSRTDLKKELDAGTSNNNQSINIRVKSSDSDKNLVKDVTIRADYDMKLTAYDDDEKVYEFRAGESKAVPVGQYDVVIDGSTGVYYNGTGYVLPGSGSLTGVEVTEVVTVNVTKNDTDIVTITSDGEYFITDGVYYFEKGYEFFLKSVNNSGEDQKIRYGYVDTEATTAAQTIDMTASDKKMTVTGYIGVATPTGSSPSHTTAPRWSSRSARVRTPRSSPRASHPQSSVSRSPRRSPEPSTRSPSPRRSGI